MTGDGKGLNITKGRDDCHEKTYKEERIVCDYFNSQRSYFPINLYFYFT